MTGYQEIITDPSYAKQIVTLTAPHIGNVGTNSEDNEAENVFAAGLVIRHLSPIASNWRNQEDLPHFLQRNKIVAISEIDTRRLTIILREKGALRGCITTNVTQLDQALEKAKSFPSMEGYDLAKEVSTTKIQPWRKQPEKIFHQVVAYDYGAKSNILDLLADRHCAVTVVPATTSAEAVLALNPDGIFLSNGPGDPAACDYAIKAIQIFLEKNIPIFGICLGHQLLALASGGQTLKMKFGHHGANHPVKNIQTGLVMITSQNHGFAVDETTLPQCLEITHRSLFDDTLQGIRRKDKPAFSFQGHPEASPGPQEMQILFDDFIQLMKQQKG
jgi:carbamoyl-phosphate synthase small subunit